MRPCPNNGTGGPPGAGGECTRCCRGWLCSVPVLPGHSTCGHTSVTQCHLGRCLQTVDMSGTVRHQLGHVLLLLKELLHNPADGGRKLSNGVRLPYGRHVDEHSPGADSQRSEVDELTEEPWEQGRQQMSASTSVVPHITREDAYICDALGSHFQPLLLASHCCHKNQWLTLVKLIPPDI